MNSDAKNDVSVDTLSRRLPGVGIPPYQIPETGLKRQLAPEFELSSILKISNP